MTTTTLSKRLEEKSQKLMKRFEEDSPLLEKIGQPLNDEIKLIFHRIFKQDLVVAPDMNYLSAKALELSKSDKEKQFWRSLANHFQDESRKKFAEEYKQFFGEMPDELRKEKPCDALAEQRTLMDRVLEENDSLHCLAMLFCGFQLWALFWKHANPAYLKALPSYQVRAATGDNHLVALSSHAYQNSSLGLDALRDVIDSHPKAQTIENRTYREYAETYMENIELELRWYNFIFTGNEYIVPTKFAERIKQCKLDLSDLEFNTSTDE